MNSGVTSGQIGVSVYIEVRVLLWSNSIFFCFQQDYHWKDSSTILCTFSWTSAHDV